MVDRSGQIRLGVIDGFELRANGVVVDVAPACQRLVAFLALWDRPVTRSFVSGSLWSDSDTEHAAACLRSVLWRLPSCDLVRSGPTSLALSDGVMVDYRETVTRAQQLLAEPASADAPAWVLPHITVLAGEILPDWYDEWVLLARERFRQLRLHALEALCTRLAAAGRFGEALLAGLAAVEIEPLRESAHRRVIEVHVLEGNVGEALRQYRTYERLLRDELSLDPSAELRALVARLLRKASGA
jgi:DNA-binding SARP family transcriptional activator